MKKAKLKDLCNIERGKIGITKAIEGVYPLIVTAEVKSSHNEWHFDEPSTIVPLVSSTGHGHASIKRIHYAEGKYAVGNILAALIPKDHKYLSAKYLFIYLSIKKEELLVSQMRGAANVSLTLSKLGEVIIEIPDIENQIKVIKQYENFEKIVNNITLQLTNSSKMIESLLKKIIQDKSCGIIKLGEHLEHMSDRINENKPTHKMIGVSNEDGITELTTSKKDGFNKYKIVSKNSFIYNPMRINIGSIALYTGNDECITSPDYVVFKIKSTYPPKALLYYLKSKKGQQEIAENVQGTVRQRLYYENLCNVNIPNLRITEHDMINGMFINAEKIESNIKRDQEKINLLKQVVLKEYLTNKEIKH